MKRYFFYIILILFLMFDLQAQKVSVGDASSLLLQKASIPYNEGTARFEVNDFRGALEKFNQALAIYPQFDKALFNRASVKHSMKDYNGTLQDLLTVTKINPSYKNLHLLLGTTYQDLNKNEEAIIALTESIAKGEGKAEAFYRRGTLQFVAGNYQEAEEDFSRSISIKPDAYAYNDRGSSKRQQENLDGAIQDYQKATTYNNELDFVHNNLGSALRQSHRFDEATTAYSKAIAINSKNEVAYNNRGLSKLGTKDYEGAIADFNKTLELKPNYEQALANRAAAKFQLKDYTGAEADCTKALAINNNFAAAFLNRGIAREMLRKDKEACDDWSKAVALGLKNAETFMSHSCN